MSNQTPLSHDHPKIQQAFKIACQADAERWPGVATFLDELRKMGGATEALLAEATWEDFESGLKVPRLIAKALAKVFRAKAEGGQGDEEARMIMAHKAMADWPVELVLAKLDPARPKSPEAQELVRRFGARPILVFDASGVFDLAATRTMV